MRSIRFIEIDETVLISGMGPAGLLAACEAIMSNKQVIIVTNRPENEQIRSRRVYVEDINFEYLRSLLAKMLRPHDSLTNEDEAFINDIDYSVTINIKKLEKFLLRRVQQYRADGYSVRIIDNSEIKSLDFDNRSAAIGSVHSSEIEESVHFNILVCADGTKRHAVSLCNEQLNTENKIRFRTGTHPSRLEHVSAYLEVRSHDDSPMVPVRSASFKRIASTDTMTSVAFTNKHSLFSTKCNVTAELPAELSATKDESEVLNYLNTIVDEVTDEKTHVRFARSKSCPGKDKTKLSFFNIELRYAENAVIDFNDVKIILIGDTQATPNYQIGNGLNDAMLEAQQLGKCMRSECSYDKYRKLCKRFNESAAHFTAIFASEPFEEKNARIKNVIQARHARKVTIERLREFFYQCFPFLPKYEISMFSMLHYVDANHRNFLNLAGIYEVLEPLLLFKSLNYGSGISKTFKIVESTNVTDCQVSSELNAPTNLRL